MKQKCAQGRFRSDSAFPESDQNLPRAYFGQPRMQRFFMKTMKPDQTAQMCRLIATDKRGYPHNSFLISPRKHVVGTH